MPATVHPRCYVAAVGVLPRDSRLPASGCRSYDAEHLQILRQLGLKSAICVPIKARGGRLAHHFRFRRVGSSFTQTDLALAEDLGRRAALG